MKACLVLLALLLVAGATPLLAAAAPGRVAVGLEPGVRPASLEQTLTAIAGGAMSSELAPMNAVVLDARDAATAARRIARIAGVRYAEVVEDRRISFAPGDPLAEQQWYLGAVRAFEAWPELPVLAPVLVAVVDSGIDYDHPEFAGRIERARSFVASSAKTDSVGHGTMVAGEIAATLGNAEGIAGVAFPARLLIAKVVGSDGTISLEAEAKAIRWAVDKGARVINLSLGGQRDPRNPDRDTFSQLEADAVSYAVARGAVVVAATGNCESECPYRYASYPAALPHVLGVGAMTFEGKVPEFSNRDALFADLVAPGAGIVSTFPRELSSGCEPAGYSICAPEEYKRGEGTSFAVPIAAAAAALVLSVRPDLQPTQVIRLLEETAVDIGRPGFDRASGHGRLDIAAAVTAATTAPPPADPFEVNRALELNEDAGARAFPLFFGGGVTLRTVEASIDVADDPIDVYRVFLRQGQRLALTYRGPVEAGITLSLHAPGTVALAESRPLRELQVVDGRARVVLESERAGWYYLALEANTAGGAYRLAVARSAAG